MYLFQLSSLYRNLRQHQFTFHYVSISTNDRSSFNDVVINLHSTMYLFQRDNISSPFSSTSFTFHYVSISTLVFRYLSSAELYLHSTMYLFQRIQFLTQQYGFQIYIPLCIYFNDYYTELWLDVPTFTFHYVSISTQHWYIWLLHRIDLHSTMYLFQRL